MSVKPLSVLSVAIDTDYNSENLRGIYPDPTSTPLARIYKLELEE